MSIECPIPDPDYQLASFNKTATLSPFHTLEPYRFKQIAQQSHMFFLWHELSCPKTQFMRYVTQPLKYMCAVGRTRK